MALYNTALFNATLFGGWLTPGITPNQVGPVQQFYAKE